MPWPAPRRPTASLAHDPGRRPRRGSWKPSRRPPCVLVWRYECKKATIPRTHGGPGGALPLRVEEAAWRMGELPEGQLGTPWPAREPRAGRGGRRRGRRRPPLAAVSVERRIPGPVRYGPALTPPRHPPNPAGLAPRARRRTQLAGGP